MPILITFAIKCVFFCPASAAVIFQRENHPEEAMSCKIHQALTLSETTCQSTDHNHPDP